MNRAVNFLLTYASWAARAVTRVFDTGVWRMRHSRERSEPESPWHAMISMAYFRHWQDDVEGVWGAHVHYGMGCSMVAAASVDQTFGQR